MRRSALPHEPELARVLERAFSCGTGCQARREMRSFLVVGRVEPEVRRVCAAEQAAGPRGQEWSARRAKPEDERLLTLG